MAQDDRFYLTWAAICFFAISGVTWFFSSRPRLFVRIFVPADELREAARGILRDPNFGHGMRTMAMLQAAVAMMVGLAACWCGLAGQ